MAATAKTALFARVRDLGLQLPGVEESTMHGSPAIKLGKRLIACLAVHRSAEPGSLVVRTSFEERDALIAEEPETFYLTPHYENHPVVLARLAKIQQDQLQGLLASARNYVLQHEAQKRARAKATRARKRS